MIKDGQEVVIKYQLFLDGFDGELFEETDENQPLSFVFGSGEMLPAFEAALKNSSVGDSFKIHLSVDDAYGPEKEEFYIEFPKSDFIGEDGEVHDELFEVGEIIPMNTPEGEEVYGVVAEVQLNTVLLDFNHPLANEELFFFGEIISIQ
jgi:FKBP-type peptidyl-prolyl cis-trans isomerase SlyD